jgi:hypothetical protein
MKVSIVLVTDMPRPQAMKAGYLSTMFHNAILDNLFV